MHSTTTQRKGLLSYIQHNNAQHYTECRVTFSVSLSVIMQNIVMFCVVAPFTSLNGKVFFLFSFTTAKGMKISETSFMKM
jgi:hypothetical protein